MRIGGNVSTKAAGTSALWHDVDYLPSQHIHTPTVERGLDDLPLPSEQHQLPPGVQDPFAKMDQVYDVAGAQMERGIEGQTFLHGRPAPADLSTRLRERAGAEEVTRTHVRPQQADALPQAPAQQEGRAQRQQLEARAQAGHAPPQVSQASEPANGRQQAERAQQAVDVAEGLGVSVAAMAVTQALDPSGALGTQAASAVKAVSVAKTAVGMAGAMRGDASTVQEGLRARRRPTLADETQIGPGVPKAE